jgi:hypothetical protein
VSTLQILLLVVLVLASASTAGLAWALHLLSHDPLTGLWTRAVLLGSAVGRRVVLSDAGAPEHQHPDSRGAPSGEDPR